MVFNQRTVSRTGSDDPQTRQIRLPGETRFDWRDSFAADDPAVHEFDILSALSECHVIGRQNPDNLPRSLARHVDGGLR